MLPATPVTPAQAIKDSEEADKGVAAACGGSSGSGGAVPLADPLPTSAIAPSSEAPLRGTMPESPSPRQSALRPQKPVPPPQQISIARPTASPTNPAQDRCDVQLAAKLSALERRVEEQLSALQDLEGGPNAGQPLQEPVTEQVKVELLRLLREQDNLRILRPALPPRVSSSFAEPSSSSRPTAPLQGDLPLAPEQQQIATARRQDSAQATVAFSSLLKRHKRQTGESEDLN